jgi:hypothetical protein
MPARKRVFGINVGATFAQGDFDGNGGIDLRDLALLQAHFDVSTADRPTVGQLAVPEPTINLVAVATFGFFAFTGRHRGQLLLPPLARFWRA